MKRYEVIKKYIIEAQDETELRIRLVNASVISSPIDKYCVQEQYKELPKVQKRAKKKRWNPWLAMTVKQLRYLVMGK